MTLPAMPPTTVRPVPQWLADAVIYEIYPQSFADSNADGIGDLPGVIEHLDYLAWLGVDVIWFNPCFSSPFRDAGYDVDNYMSIAPRYGTNEDMERLIQAARDRGIRILLDLVAGHTSVDHPWFQRSLTTPGDDRYIWADSAAESFVESPGDRSGWYLKNFFEEQPALNFGYARLDPAEPWRQLPSDRGPRANRDALKEIIAFWLDMGIAGFRVDMAFSLVKDDPDLTETAALWRHITSWMHDSYPEAVLLPESDENRTPTAGTRGGFDADFSLVIHPEHSALFNNGTAGLLPWEDFTTRCYFDPDVSREDGTAALETFLGLWNSREQLVGEERLVVLPSSDHDFSRLASGPRTKDQLRAAFLFLLTWGTIPSIYYGDEIGMKNIEGLPDTEGSIWNPKFNRAGCRTPMQWTDSRPNAGFSLAQPEDLYLPQDQAEDRPTVEGQQDDHDSLLHFVRRLIHLRRSIPHLRTGRPREVLAVGYPLAYLRGGTHLIVINPRAVSAKVTLDSTPLTDAQILLSDGLELHGGLISVAGHGYGIIALSP